MRAAASAGTDRAARDPARWRRVRAFAWDIVLAVVLHAVAALALVLLLARWGVELPAARGDDGENGRRGAGGPTVEISIRSPEPGPPAPPSEPPRPDAPSTAVRRTSPHVLHTAPLATRRDVAPDAVASSDAPAREAVLPASGGTGGDVTSGGLRAGSIGQQRALLPQAAVCRDLVAGVWLGRRYVPAVGEWRSYTLYVHRDASDAATLHGQIVARYWTGPADDLHPPPCVEGLRDRTVTQPAVGRVDDVRVVFGGQSWSPASSRCGGPAPPGSYHPDHFSGSVDGTRQEFQSVNNDGFYAVDAPTVFRRIRCLRDTTGRLQGP